MEFARHLSSVLGVKPEKSFNIEKTEQSYAVETTAKVKRATRCIFAMAKRQRLVDDNYASADYVSYGKSRNAISNIWTTSKLKNYFP